MKKTLLASIIILNIILIAACQTKNDTQISKPIVFKMDPVTMIAKSDSVFTKKGLHYLFIKASLKNNTADSFRYHSMTCSWDASFTTDSKKVKIQHEACYVNVPCLVTISPGKMNEYKLTIETHQLDSNLKFKIGCNLIPDMGMTNDIQIYDSLNSFNHLIWSNNIEMKK